MDSIQAKADYDPKNQISGLPLMDTLHDRDAGLINISNSFKDEQTSTKLVSSANDEISHEDIAAHFNITGLPPMALNDALESIVLAHSHRNTSRASIKTFQGLPPLLTQLDNLNHMVDNDHGAEA